MIIDITKNDDLILTAYHYHYYYIIYISSDNGLIYIK